MGSISPPADKLFTPLKVGNDTLSSRLVMAPLTRFRANADHIPQPKMKVYYSQRACIPGTLLITEATPVSAAAGGMANLPHIVTPDQIAAWKDIVDGVHEKGGLIYLQLWALGRAADPEQKRKEGSGDVVSASAIPMSEGGHIPRALEESEIKQYVSDFATGAKNAVEGAGFDGVEIHAANGYLIDQFTQDVSNHRTDGYGGSIEKRARFALEVTKAVVDAVGAEKTGIRLSPFSTFQGMKMQDPLPQFSHLIEGLRNLKLAYLHLVESRISGSADAEATEKIDPLVELWPKDSPVFIAGGFKPDSAKRAVEEEYADRQIAVVFGRYWISNPDLAYRLQHGIDLNPYDRSTFYLPESEKGYTDQPFSEEYKKERGGKL
ncbi:hypothetical protein B0A48_06165 [Cryoendolithus antarcticus]|uniref:NADH:flavin oxidoreductase/NADH oxidase N-terminal domain-containing protein n=1 Tax=Cryoendolithus antarcticus TaxID=1507870 RepID=A0A1V8TA82_9PEZI|nr:hypothetical protein B0A48_06165 [Cryoendolithus antarcticus]